MWFHALSPCQVLWSICSYSLYFLYLPLSPWHILSDTCHPGMIRLHRIRHSYIYFYCRLYLVIPVTVIILFLYYDPVTVTLCQILYAISNSGLYYLYLPLSPWQYILSDSCHLVMIRIISWKMNGNSRHKVKLKCSVEYSKDVSLTRLCLQKILDWHHPNFT